MSFARIRGRVGLHPRLFLAFHRRCRLAISAGYWLVTLTRKKRGFDAMALCKMLIQVVTPPKSACRLDGDLKRTLCVSPPTRSITASASPNFFLKALGLSSRSPCLRRGCAAGISSVRRGRDGSYARAGGPAEPRTLHVSCRPHELDHRLTCFELGLIKQRLLCRHGNDRNGGGFNVS